jgi:polyadenylation factor subunit 2
MPPNSLHQQGFVQQPGPPFGQQNAGAEGQQNLQRAWERRFLDFHSSTIKFAREDAVNVESHVGHDRGLSNFPQYAKRVESMLSFRDPVSQPSGVCCKFTHVAVNKNRCSVNVVEWLNNGRRLLTGNHVGEFTMWNGTNFSFENMLQAHPCPIRAFHWMPDGSTLLSGDALGVVKFWDANFYPFVTFQAHKEPIRDLTSSPNGAKFATCADEAHAKIWDFRTGQEERLLKGHGWDIKTCQWHPSKSLVATGSKDCSIKLWDPRANEAISTIYCHKSVVTRIRWSPDGQWLASGSRDQLVKVLDIRKMSVGDRILKSHVKEVTSLAWHPIDPTLLTSGSYDGQISFWDVNHNKPIETLIGAHEAAVWSIAYHPLGNQMVTSSHDCSTKFWGRGKPGDGDPQELLPKGKAYMMHQQAVGAAPAAPQPSVTPAMVRW